MDKKTQWKLIKLFPGCYDLELEAIFEQDADGEIAIVGNYIEAHLWPEFFVQVETPLTIEEIYQKLGQMKCHNSYELYREIGRRNGPFKEEL